MSRKRTNYEKRGLVRHIAESIFASQKERSSHLDTSWRPRKTHFERLEGDDLDEDDEVESRNDIHRAFSIESEMIDYKRELLFDEKKAAFGSQKAKRDVSAVIIKPSARDQRLNRTLARNKRSRKIHLDAFDDSFGLDPFSSKKRGKSDDSVDDSASRQTSTSRQSTSTRNTEFQTVRSDPSDFFSKKANKLTKQNLDLLESMPEASSSNVGIENINRRDRFHQFTVEEDKASTIVDPVVYPGDETIVGSDEDQEFDEDSQLSFGYTSKGTLVRKGGPRVMQTFSNEFHNDTFSLFEKVPDTDNFEQSLCLPEKVNDSFFADVGVNPSYGVMLTAIRTQSSPINNGEKMPRRDPSQQFQSNHSLVYSESSCEDLVEFNEPHLSFRNSSVKDAKSSKASSIQRVPLSPLNVIRPSKHKAQRPRKFTPIEPKPDPDAAWASFPGSFEKKPDPKGDDSKILSPPAKQPDQYTPGKRLNEVSFPEGNVDEGDIDDDDRDPEYNYMGDLAPFAKPIGIQSFPHAKGMTFSTSSLSAGSMPRHRISFHSRSVHDGSLNSSRHLSSFDVSDIPGHEKIGDQDRLRSNPRLHRDNALCFHGLPKSRCLHLDDNDEGSMGKNSMSSVSFTKPLGVPNNAIMASMLFRRHFSDDAQIVEEKLKAKEQEYKPDRDRAGIPRSIQALDGLSCVSSFSEDTAAQIAAWRKPTRDLLEHFSRSHRPDYTDKMHSQSNNESELFEA